jgi:hypothetical protein
MTTYKKTYKDLLTALCMNNKEFDSIKKLRAKGYAITIFEPSELEGVSSAGVEIAMGNAGIEYINEPITNGDTDEDNVN